MGESRITPSGIINDAVSMIGKMNDSSFQNGMGYKVYHIYGSRRKAGC